MARARSELLIIGVGSHVVGIDSRTGDEMWRTKLKSSSFITVQHVGDRVFAGARGELFCLDARSGSLLWNNKLKGLGVGMVTFGAGSDSAMAAMVQAQQTAAIAAAT